MTPYLEDPDFILYQGDALAVLRELDGESVDCCVTSPPYWGLRDYGTASWEGGDPDHEHAGAIVRTAPPGAAKQASNRGALDVRSGDCVCGARRVDPQLGLEPSPDEYVEAMVAVFREVRRVLRPDGTLWLNLGDSYASNGGQRGGVANSGINGSPKRHSENGVPPRPRTPAAIVKPKDLVGVPWRVAFALQADGWYLRSDIVWSKPNPMPESVTDRPTKAHEYVFLLAKSARYYFDQGVVRESNASPEQAAHNARYAREYPLAVVEAGQNSSAGIHSRGNANGRNVRSVWEIATQPYPDAHFATFPQELVRRCILAGCPEGGIVLDPFLGSGTTAFVARAHGRRAIGIELNPDYCALIAKRTQQQSLLA